MNNRDKMSTLAGAAIVIGFAAVLFAPARATSQATSVAADGIGYLPAQYVNHATQIEPVRATF